MMFEVLEPNWHMLEQNLKEVSEDIPKKEATEFLVSFAFHFICTKIQNGPYIFPVLAKVIYITLKIVRLKLFISKAF